MFSKLYNSILDRIIFNTNEARPYFKICGIYLWSYAFFYLFNQLTIKADYYEDSTFRIIICALGTVLFFHSYWEKYFKNFTPLIFYFSIFFSFGFFFSYMLFKNPYSNIWQLNQLTGLVVLSIFVDWRSFFILSILSILIAFSVAADQPLSHYEHLISVYGSYSSPVICLFIFNSKRKNLQSERDSYNKHVTMLNETLELRIKERTEELQKALAIKSDFLNNISHEIRTPLHGFLTLSEGLAENWDGIAEERKRRYISDIFSNAKRLCALVNDILDLSKLSNNKMIMHIEQTSINALIYDIIQECNALYLIHKNINIIFSPENDFVIEVDPIRIKQVFRNILSNAIKFTPNDGEIKIKIILEENDILISVADTGIGIPQGELQSIFDSFTQSSRTKTGAGGTGLGLSIAQNIIYEHHGKIWAESNSTGSVFYISFPRTIIC